MPSRIVLTVSGNGNLSGPLFQRLECIDCAVDLILPAHDAHQLLHHRLQIVFYLVGAFATALPVEGLERRVDDRISMLRIDSGRSLSRRKLSRVLSGPHSEYQEI